MRIVEVEGHELGGGGRRIRGIELSVVKVCDHVSGWEGTGFIIGVIRGRFVLWCWR